MKIATVIRKTPLAALMGSVLLLAGTGCHKAANEAASNTPPAASTAPSVAAATTPTTTPATTTGNASGTMGNETAGTAGTTGSSAADMSGASATGSETANTTGMSGADNTSALTSGPVTDTQFYTTAMTGDQEEIATGKMVASQTSNADVKRVANKIANDHQAFDNKVKAAAGSTVTPPATTGAAAVDPAVQGKTGKDLDRAYADAMVSDHQKDIPVFENVAKNGSTPTARKLASEALPKLRDHLKLAQDLQKKL